MSLYPESLDFAMPNISAPWISRHEVCITHHQEFSPKQWEALCTSALTGRLPGASSLLTGCVTKDRVPETLASSGYMKPLK